MALSVKYSGAWQEPAVSVRDGGAWKTPEQVYVRDGGLWVPLLDTAPPPTTLTFDQSAASAVDAITIPALAQEGDLCVWARYGYVASLSGKSGHPAGWSTIRASQLSSSGYYIYGIWYKVLEAGDPGTSPTGYRSTLENHIGNVMLTFRPDNPISSAVVSGGVHTISHSNPSSITITSSGATAPALVVGMAASTGGGLLSVESPAFDDTYSGGDVLLGYKIYNDGASPVNHTIDMSDRGSANVLMGGYLSIS